MRRALTRRGRPGPRSKVRPYEVLGGAVQGSGVVLDGPVEAGQKVAAVVVVEGFFHARVKDLQEARPVGGRVVRAAVDGEAPFAVGILLEVGGDFFGVVEAWHDSTPVFTARR